MADDVPAILARLPGFDCLRCGTTCEGLAGKIAAGEASEADCDPLSDHGVELTVDGAVVPLTPFPREMLCGAVLGAVAALKGCDGPVHSLQLRIVRDDDGPGADG